jgi:uncharacterized protein
MHGRPKPPPTDSFSVADLERLQQELDRVPEPLEPLDVVMLDGYLCGVLLQPRPPPASRWLPHVTDVDGRALPERFDATALHALVKRRHAQLAAAIAHRQWFDPWVFELEGADDDDPSAAVFPWVAGFATALELFPDLNRIDDPALTEPLALMYRHLDPDDLEDADALLEEIETLEPPADLAEAVEDLVRATLLIADVTQPAPKGNGARRPRR